MTTERGILITFEGIDGAGKTTQIRRLAQSLEAAGYDVVETREPGGTPIGDQIRGILLSPSHDELSARSEVLLYAASRAQLVDEVIRPNLAAGRIVLCDRFVDASIAYQGAGLELGEAEVRRVNQFALSGVMPDLTLLFELSWTEARARLMMSRGPGQLDRIESRDESFFQRVEQAFEALANEEPSRIHRVDATKTPDALEQEIHHIVWKYTVDHNLSKG